MGLNHEQAIVLRDKRLADDPDFYRKMGARATKKRLFAKGTEYAREMGRLGGSRTKLKKETS